ncbi:TPA: DUF927 domain-containing protein [Clostridioides difficile]|nr:DUF927 domain-containing protein [Clostridioides difficile]
MAIKKVERKPLIVPDWYKEKEKEMNLESQVTTNEDTSQKIQVVDKEVQVIDTKESSNEKDTLEVEFVNDEDESIPQENDEFEEVDNNLLISKKLGLMVFEGDKTANLLKLGTPELNIDTGKITLPLNTTYMGQTIELNVPKDRVSSKREIIKLSADGADVNEINAKHHINAIAYQEKHLGMIRNIHSEIGYCMYNGKEVFKLYDAINVDSRYCGSLDIKPKGTLDEYLKDIKNLVMPYRNMSLAFALGVSSAVVAKLNKSGEDINTLLAHFVTESSKGKSTATMLAISVWGNPNLGVGGLYNTWNSTENALITSLTGNYGVAYALDELSMSKIEDTTSLIYNIVGGKDKARLTKEIELRKSGTWATTIISNGEASILSRAKNNTGLEVRTLELEGVVWTEDAKHSDEVKALVNRNYGVFGYSFAKKLVNCSINKIKLLFEKEKEIFLEKLKESGTVDNMIGRTSSKYALVTLTVTLINAGYRDYGINLDIEGIRELLVETEVKSIQRRGIKRKAEDWLIQYVETNASKFKCGTESNSSVDYWGSRKELPNGELEIAILKNKFEEIMKQGKFEDTNVVLDQLKKEGKLDYEEGRLTRKRKINAITTPVYVIKLKL